MSDKYISSVPDGPFDLLNIFEPEALKRVKFAVDSGALPADTFLRLDSLGDGVVDAGDEEPVNLRRKILLDLKECMLLTFRTPSL